MHKASLMLAAIAACGVCLWAIPQGSAHRALADDGATTEKAFQAFVRPFLNAHCISCHGKEKPQGDLDLTSFATAEAVARDLPRWELVLEQIEAKSMPPAKAKKQPSPDARQELATWIRAVRKSEAARNAGDPGSVPARRLSNAEYDATIRDLTGADIRPTQEFPVDPANKAGFDNTAESLTMSPSLVKKYLEAARRVSDHLVLKSEGFEFASHPVVADTDRDKYSVRRIIDFYQRQPTQLHLYFQAAWRYKHRAALGHPDSTLEEIARAEQISPRYLGTVWDLLTRPAGEVGPVAALQLLWRELPGPTKPDAALDGCSKMSDFVRELRTRLTPEVRNLSVRGMNNGAQPLVLWKNRQFVENRRKYAGNAAKIRPRDLKSGTEAARMLALPQDSKELERYVPSLTLFCSTFPDAFLVSERARVYLDQKGEKENAGRLLSAGFHSMTGYFRDDAPLSELILDDASRRELDRLWLEFDMITGAPARQYSSFLWFERTDSVFMRESEFDFARAEDKDAGSDAMVKRLALVYEAKARRNGASPDALAAIKTYFEQISKSLRRVEQVRIQAEPSHLVALQNFAEKAYRRPLTSKERDAVVAFYQTLRKDDGLNHEEAVRDTVVSILMSPHFCYRFDLPSGGTGIRPLSDHDLANRLSYFLWSSMPDQELLALATAGDLHRPEILRAQTRRMLRDAKVRGLATEFCGNWLDFRRFEEHNSVDRARFSSFTDELRRSMFEEPIRYFLDIVQQDRPVSELLDGKHTFVNSTLARQYGIVRKDLDHNTWTRVDDATEFGRGGLLPMAVFLTKNAPGLRTSPVKRGYWVVRRLLGEHIPAPPNNVPELPNDEAKLGELTLREALARHRADKSCSGCHERFDSIGLAFEGYGPIGERRTRDLGGRPIETRVGFPDGSDGDGLAGLRNYLGTKRRDEFVDNLCKKLLSYGLGRTLIPSDEEVLEAMRRQATTREGRFGLLIESIVTSPQFQNKRFESGQAEE